MARGRSGMGGRVRRRGVQKPVARRGDRDYLAIMVPDVSTVGYVIWGVDHAVYGPVELPTLVDWIKDERVVSDTWLFVQRNACWEKADRVPELQMFFHKRPAAVAVSAGTPRSAAPPEELQSGRVAAPETAGMFERRPTGTHPAICGGPDATGGDAVHQARGTRQCHVPGGGGGVAVQPRGGRRRATAGNVNAGEFFGEISLFDQGARAADISVTQEKHAAQVHSKGNGAHGGRAAGCGRAVSVRADEEHGVPHPRGEQALPRFGVFHPPDQPIAIGNRHAQREKPL